MNYKISSLAFFVCILLTFSCKSESKKNQDTSNEPTSEEKNITNLESEYQNETKDISNEAQSGSEDVVSDTNPPEDVQVPKKKKPLRKSKATPTNNSKGDKGVEIEMGHEEENKKEDVEDSNIIPVTEEKETKPEKEVKTDKPDKPEKVEKFVGFPSHSLFDGLLKKHVSATGVVDYKGLKSAEATLDRYLAILESNPPGTTWNRNQELAFWINAYNAYTIKLILKNYPLKSITNLDGGKPWDVKWIKLDGKTLSLNNIENDIIRKKYKEPRIHFAVNCAAKSCPPLLNAAYNSKSLESQLVSQTKKFINNPVLNKLEKNAIQVSKIFDWYAADFGDIASFVMRYADKTVKPSAKVSYMEYDWNLNGK